MFIANYYKNNDHDGSGDMSDSSSCFDFEHQQYNQKKSAGCYGRNNEAPKSTYDSGAQIVVSDSINTVKEDEKVEGSIDDAANKDNHGSNSGDEHPHDDVVQFVSKDIHYVAEVEEEGVVEVVDNANSSSHLVDDNHDGYNYDGNKASTTSIYEDSYENEESTCCNNGGEEEASVIWIKMAQITTDKNGVALVQDELNARGIKYDAKWKIRKLKNVLTNEGLDGEKEFKPKSSLIIQANEDGLI